MADKINIKSFLSLLDDEQKESFKSMTREDQLLSIFGIEISNSNRLAVVEKKQIDTERDMKEYRKLRERRENNGDEEIMNTTQKILKAIADQKAKEFNTWIYIRDRVLPNILSPAILILLYLIFTQLKP
jgi:hypothetical protein